MPPFAEACSLTTRDQGEHSYDTADMMDEVAMSRSNGRPLLCNAVVPRGWRGARSCKVTRNFGAES